ncbi:MAG: hypothetical protein AB1602_05700 [Elusimicrobiota bacterium]
MLRNKYRKNIKIIKELAIVFIAIALFSSCKTAPERHTYTIGQTQQNKFTVTVSSNYRNYKLKKYQDYHFEERFKNAVENSYSKTADKYKSNFTYSIKTQGAVYPFSDVDIICITDNKISLSKAKDICEDFFANLDLEYEKMKGELK